MSVAVAACAFNQRSSGKLTIIYILQGAWGIWLKWLQAEHRSVHLTSLKVQAASEQLDTHQESTLCRLVGAVPATSYNGQA